MSRYYVAVDVGTASVRAALVTPDGQVKHTAEESVVIWEPRAEHYEQSSADIWSKCCRAVKRVTQDIDVPCVRGLGFDATCSLVALDRHFQPVAVNHTGVRERNVVMWMDHRAAEQAARITHTKHRVLQGVGGVMSPEMQPAKLLICRKPVGKTRHISLTFQTFYPGKLQGPYAGHQQNQRGEMHSLSGGPPLVDPALVSRDDSAASSSPMANAMGYPSWSQDPTSCDVPLLFSFLQVLLNACRTPPRSVYVAAIAKLDAPVAGQILGRSNLIVRFQKWVDHVVNGHAASRQLKEQAEKSGKHVYSCLNLHLEHMSGDAAQLEQLTAGLHIWPDFHGNRSPLADQTSRGSVVGLTLSQTLDDLALLYLATLQAIALGTRHILDTMKEAGYDITTLFLCGGLSKNALFVQTHANTTGQCSLTHTLIYLT
ncbi:FGGY carbohydrate kinase domain-containing protein-like [Siphateles boraxobius]|uniref:FGGY carbohydrate kinase domain-containing protein-like n=1 Tax=Siphateles boraxobius TaxID=180520 RepID=UPI00406353DD